MDLDMGLDKQVLVGAHSPVSRAAVCDPKKITRGGAELLDSVDAFRIIREEISKYANQRIFAEKVGVTPQYLSDMINGRKPLSDVVLRSCKIRRKVYFERIA
ncbi:hypothetical protein HK28_12585 [Acetobacter sp. DsW_063]|nr:hypothetical protein HK28_12585 [Acetobacter sp. DsW_063]